MSKKNISRSSNPNLRAKYKEMVIPAMMKQFGYSNLMEVPKITHVSINMGIGDGKDSPKKLESVLSELTVISGQKPVVTRSRKDISNFKIRKGFPVGCKVTIRGNRMVARVLSSGDCELFTGSPHLSQKNMFASQYHIN